MKFNTILSLVSVWEDIQYIGVDFKVISINQVSNKNVNFSMVFGGRKSNETLLCFSYKKPHL